MELDHVSKHLLNDIINENENIKNIIKAYIEDTDELKIKNNKFIQSYYTFIKAIKNIYKINKISNILLNNILIFYKNLRGFYSANLNKDNLETSINLKLLLLNYVSLAKFSYLIGILINRLLFKFKYIINDTNYLLYTKMITSIKNENGEEIDLILDKKGINPCAKLRTTLKLNDSVGFCVRYNIFLCENLKIDFVIKDINIDDVKEKILLYFNEKLIKLTSDIKIILDKDITDTVELEKNLISFNELVGDNNLYTSLNELKRYNEIESIRNKLMTIINIFEKIKKDNTTLDINQLIITSINIFKFLLEEIKFDNFFDMSFIIYRLIKIKYGLIDEYKKSIFDNELDFFIKPVDDIIGLIEKEYIKIISETYLKPKKGGNKKSKRVLKKLS